MKNSIVTVKNLSHRYSIHWAVKDVSFELFDNGVTGLLGSNGAGKSTTMNIICGVINQTEGDVFINGINMAANSIMAKKSIGFLPQTPPLLKDLTVHEYLSHCASLRFIESKNIKRSVEEAMDRCSITHFSNRLIKNLSGGYQQRVGIAQAIVHNPKFIILDEPTSGLDPNQVVDIRTLIKEISENHCVLLSTHILTEVQAICKDIKMIENGSLVFSGTMDDFNNYIQPESFTITLTNPPPVEELKKLFNISELSILENNSYRIKLNDNISSTTEFIKLSHINNWGLKGLILDRCSIDEVFAQISGITKK